MHNDLELACDVEECTLLELARREIEQLRHWYAIATDLLGRTDDSAARQRGLTIYHRIFAPDAQISVQGSARPLAGRGPDAWADVARDALAEYEATQHLIGTQVVSFASAAFGGRPKAIASGEATMMSYLQAWHASPDRQLRLVLGTYEDTVRLMPAIGWQITTMVLAFASGERRELGGPP